jgi:hypothetical protein
VNIRKLKGHEKTLQMTGKCKLQERKSSVPLYIDLGLPLVTSFLVMETERASEGRGFYSESTQMFAQEEFITLKFSLLRRSAA